MTIPNLRGFGWFVQYRLDGWRCAAAIERRSGTDLELGYVRDGNPAPVPLPSPTQDQPADRPTGGPAGALARARIFRR
jgi:hypothetical protein